MNKLSMLATAIVAASVTSAAFAAPPPPPSMYNNGPQSFQVSATDLSQAEMAGYALYEGVLTAAEAAIAAKASCSALAGSYHVTTFADGISNSPTSNTTTVLSPGGSLTINAKIFDLPFDTGRGKVLYLAQVGPGQFGDVSLKDYKGFSTFNNVGTMMAAGWDVLAKGVNGNYDPFAGKIIKDFYRDVGLTSPATLRAATDPRIFDWGLQSVFKVGYPINKWWQRSVSLRDDGYIGRTIFVKDRLVGATSCRITLDTSGSNNASIFWQDGTLTISTVKPSAPVAGF